MIPIPVPSVFGSRTACGRLFPWLLAAVLHLQILAGAQAAEQNFEAVIFSDAATHAYGSTGALDTTIFRSGTASWQIGYTSDFATSNFNPLGATAAMSALSPYAGNGYFEFYYRSSKAGTIRFQVRDSGAADALIFNPDNAPILTPIVPTEEWTRVQIPFNGWATPPSSTANWRLQIRAWGGLTGATVHYDDIRFVATGEPAVPVAGVSVEPVSLALAVGESGTLTATIAPENASDKTVNWTTSSAAVATVASTGAVTAVAEGIATITATTEDGGFSASAEVTVTAAPSNEFVGTIFADAATHAYGSTGSLNTTVVRSGTASWQIAYSSDFATSNFNPQGADVTMAGLTPYAGSGYFEFWYRSTTAGTIRFQVRDSAAGDAIIFNPDNAPILTPIVATEQWTRVEIPFNGWATPPSSTANWRLQIRAWGGLAGATVYYDDIRFVVPASAGNVPALSVSVSPDAWSMEVGQSQQLTATVGPPNATNKSVAWTSSNPSVADVDANGMVTAVGAGDATITVTTDDGGHAAESAISVVAAPGNLHPYLYFTADDIPAIRDRVNAPEVANRRVRLINRANALLNAPPATDSRNMEGNSGILAFTYIVTGEVQYAQRAIAEVLAAAALENWITGHDFNRGADLVSSEYSLGTALVYDWCYDVMTPAQRTTIRNALLEKGVAQYFSSVDPALSPNWWVYDPVNNWRGVCHGGSGIAALVLYHESELARRAADLANQHLPLTLGALMLADSGGHEGITYNNYGVEFALKGAMAMQRFYGGYETLLSELAEDRLGNYWSVYLFGPDHHFANISRMNYTWGEGLYGAGGGVEGGPSSLRSALFDSLVPGGDQLLRWAADNGGQRFYWNGASPFYFLWRRGEAPSTYQAPAPALQEAVLFRGAGHGVFQSDRLWMAYSGGATHNRGDGGAFVLAAKAGDQWERLIHLEPSLSFFGSAYQSTYLINGVGQRTGLDTLVQRAEYLRFGSGAGFHYAASNLRPLYANTALSKLNRHVVVIRGKYVVLLDDLAGSEALNFETRFQTTTANTIALGGTSATVLGSQHDLHVVSGGFDPFVIGQGTGGAVRHVSFSRQAQEAALLTVLYPDGKGGTAPTVQVENGVVTISHGDETDEIVFVRDAQDWRLSAVNGASADGIPTGAERNVVPYRDGRDDEDEVPSWLLATVGEPVVIPVTGLTVGASSVTLNVGQNQTVTANVTPADASDRNIVWSSSNPAVAIVNQTALNAASIRGVGVGAATITATTSDGGYSAPITVTVNTLGEIIIPYAAAAPLLNGAIDAVYGSALGVINKPAPGEPTPSPATLSANWRAVFTQTDLHVIVDVTDDAWITAETNSWQNDGIELFLDGNNSKNATSDNLNDVKFAFVPQPNNTVLVITDVFPPNPPGLDLSGVQAAFTLRQTDEAEYQGYVLEAKVPLSVLGITPQEGHKIGIDFQINDNDTPGARDRYVTWFGSNLNNRPDVYGTAAFGAMEGGGGPGTPVAGVSLAPDALTLGVGATEQLTATVDPVDASNSNVSWTTSNAAIATVDAGVVTAVALGEAVITVTTEDGGFTATSIVSVIASPGTVPSITTATLPSGQVGAVYGEQLTATGGEGALIWSMAGGSLPDGLALSPAGLIAGTPTAQGTSTFTVRVADSDAATGAYDEDTQTLSITIMDLQPVAATVTLEQLRQAYDGTPKSVVVVTDPAGLNVEITYDGSSTPPTLPGSYAVVVTVEDDDYAGSASGTLVISITALVRHAPTMNADIDGSVQMLLDGNATLNGNAMISGDLLVPGTPTIRLNGQPLYGGTLDGIGSISPSGYMITLNGNAVLRHVVRRTDPIALPTVDAPPAPTGTVSASLNNAGQGVDDWAVLRNLTLNGSAGLRAVPPGTYGNFNANGSSGFILGVPGATEPASYHFQSLVLNALPGSDSLQIVGPVIITLANGTSVNGTIGSSLHPEWLTLRIASGGLTLNGNAVFNGDVIAPQGTVTLNGNSSLNGTVIADRLTLNGNALLSEPKP